MPAKSVLCIAANSKFVSFLFELSGKKISALYAANFRSGAEFKF